MLATFCYQQWRERALKAWGGDADMNCAPLYGDKLFAYFSGTGNISEQRPARFKVFCSAKEFE